MIRVVVVDDNPDLLLLSETAAAAWDEVEVAGMATSAPEALACIDAVDPDVVVLDVILGASDGLELLEQLRASAPDRPVVVMSALGEMIADEALERGAAAFVAKDAAFTETLRAAVSGVVAPPAPRSGARFVGYHHLVGVAGLVALAVLGATVGLPARPWLFAGFVVASLVAYRVPVSVIAQGRAERTVHLTAQVFVAALLLLPPGEAALAVSVGGSVAVVSRRLDRARTAMGVGLLPLQYIAGAGVAAAFGADEVGWQVVGAMAGSAVAVVVNLGVFAPAAVVGSGVPLRRFLADVVPVCAVVWLFAAPVGAATGLLGHDHVAAMALLAVPQVLLLVWSAQHIRLLREQRRVAVLLDTSTRAHAARSAAEVEDVIREAAIALLGVDSVRITSERPGCGLGVELDDGVRTRWLVAPATVADPEARQLLEGIAATGSAALRNAAQRAADRSAARHDPTTGLANGALFAESLERAMALADRDRTAVTVLYVDLDRFKPINDRLGHAAGDRALRAVAERLAGALRACDLPARLGGDEFAVLLPGVGADRAAVQATAERIRTVVEAPIVLGDDVVAVGASIGGASYPADGSTAAEVLVAADAAMYADKRRRSVGVRSGR